MAVVKIKYNASRCMNVLCNDRLPNGACDVGEKPETCLLSKSYNKISESLKDNTAWDLVKARKFKELVDG